MAFKTYLFILLKKFCIRITHVWKLTKSHAETEWRQQKKKNQLCHNAPGSLHYLEIVAPRIMRKKITKAENIFLPLPEAGENKRENTKWKQEDGNYCQKHEASVHKQLGLNICVQNEFWTRVRELQKNVLISNL